MTLLNTAHMLYLGSSAASRAYLGPDLVWSLADQFVWPNATNCGIPLGTVLTEDDRDGITVSDEVFTGVHFTRFLEFYFGATGTKFINCKFSGVGFYQLLCQWGGNLEFDHCTFDGAGSVQRNVACSGIFRNCDFSGAMLSLVLGNGSSTVEYNYIHDMQGPEGTHFDGLFVGGNQTECWFKDNLISMPTSSSGTAGIFINTQGAPSVGPFHVEHNRIFGRYSFPIYLEGPDLGPVHIIDNELQFGDYAYLGTSAMTPTTISGNRDAYTFDNIDVDMGGPLP